MPALHITISGTVQGVFFRAHTKLRADELEVRGWVQNNENGTVEIHAEGDPQNLDALLDWCNEGPEQATVTGMEVAQCPEENYPDFTIRK